MIIRKGGAEIARIARAGDLVARTIAHVGERIQPGVTTRELDDVADAFIRENGGVPTSLGYRGVTDVRQGKFFEVALDGVPADQARQTVEEIAREVLANPVIESYRVEVE